MIDIEIISVQQDKEITSREKEIIKNVIDMTDNVQIQKLNKEYRGLDQPTDVLSFAINDNVDGDMEIIYDEVTETPELLGDIVISITMVVKQAQEYGHSFARELGFLSVHGFLHLIGYDHQTKEDEIKMFAKQDKILEQLGLTR